MRILFSISFFVLTAINALGQDSLYQVALGRFIQSDYQNAYTLFQETSNHYRIAGSSSRYALCHIKMAECLVRLNQNKEALSLVRSTQAYIDENLENSQYLLAETHRVIGEALLNLGQYDESLESLLLAENTYPDNAQLEKAETYNLLGVSYWNNQNESLALQYHQSALEIRKELQGDESIKVADSYNNIGLIHLENQPFQALIYFKKSLDIYESILGTLHPKVAFTMINLARTNSVQGRYEAAKEWITKVNQIWDQLYPNMDHPNKAFTLSVEGEISAGDGNIDEALLHQQSALQQYIRLNGKKHPDVANQYQLLGKLYRQKNEFRESIHAFQEAIYANLPDQEFSSDYEIPSLNNYLHADYLLSALMDKAAILETYHFEKTLRPRELKTAISTYILADELINTIRTYRVQESDKIRLGITARQLYESGCRLARILGDQPFMSSRYYPIIFDFVERSKASVLQQAIQDTKAKSFSGIPDELLAIEDSLKSELAFFQQQIAAGESIQINQKKAFEYQTAYRNFVSQLELDYPKYYELKHGSGKITVDSIQRSLNPSSALIQYFIGKDNAYILLVTSKKLTLRVVSFNEENIKSVKAFRNAIYYKVNDRYKDLAINLYEKLLPFDVSGFNQLIIIPDGILNTIPFEAFINPSSNRYVIEDLSINYSFSASLYIQNRNSVKELGKEAFLCAPVAFDFNEKSLPTLLSSEKEVRDLSVLFRANGIKTNTLIENDAKESEIKNLDLTNYSYLHMATHGEVNQSKPELSRIFLRNDDTQDGILYSGEIYGLKLNARLTSLSACETGLGQITTGEGIVGLSRALLYAGSSNLIVSLWKVSDDATAAFMLDFYERHLINQNGNFSQPLREAKLSLIASDQYNNPYFWAPFVLIGD